MKLYPLYDFSLMYSNHRRVHSPLLAAGKLILNEVRLEPDTS